MAKSRAKNRPKRVPQHKRDILTVDQREGYVRRWVNDTPGRIQSLEETGYTTVKKPTEVGDTRAGEASQLGSTVRKSVGGGVEAVLMEIPAEFYGEDQAERETDIKRRESGLIPETLKDEGSYGEGVSINRSLEQSSGGPKVTIE